MWRRKNIYFVETVIDVYQYPSLSIRLVDLVVRMNTKIGFSSGIALSKIKTTNYISLKNLIYLVKHIIPEFGTTFLLSIAVYLALLCKVKLGPGSGEEQSERPPWSFIVLSKIKKQNNVNFKILNCI